MYHSKAPSLPIRIALHIFGQLQIFLRNMNSLPIAKYENESPHSRQQTTYKWDDGRVARHHLLFVARIPCKLRKFCCMRCAWHQYYIPESKFRTNSRSGLVLTSASLPPSPLSGGTRVRMSSSNVDRSMLVYSELHSPTAIEKTSGVIGSLSAGSFLYIASELCCSIP